MLLAGVRFGRLVVVARQKTQVGKVAYLCKCDCGKEKSVPTSDLRSGRTRSCGCLRRESVRKVGQANRTDTIPPGTRFGRLVVVAEHGRISGHVAYICKCDCGAETTVTASALSSGKTRSCKCMKLAASKRNGYANKTIIDPNTRFGKLVTVSEHGRIGTEVAYLCKCDCGNDRSIRAASLSSGNTKSCGCLRSQAELDLLKFVRDSLPETEVVHNDRMVLDPSELDVWIPAKALAIEFDGVYWHGESIDPAQRFDSYKKHLACRGLGIRLITILEDEWKLKRPIVEGYLRSIFGQKKTVGARKCVVERADASEFFDATHLQGSVQGTHYRLTLNGEAVAAAAFSKATKSKAMGSAGVWELTRYAALPALSVAGGCSKLLQAFLRDTPGCRQLISYSDNRWSAGGMYEAMGFKCTVESKPSFSYFRKGKFERVHRFNWRKSEALRVYGGSPAETEWEIMQRNGWDRIWDCGKKRWELQVEPSSTIAGALAA